MLSIPWWGWLALVVGAVIVASMVASEVIEDRELRKREPLDESGDAGDEIAVPVAKSEEAPAEHAIAAPSATSERRAPRPKRKPTAKPKRKKSPARKRKTARGRK